MDGIIRSVKYLPADSMALYPFILYRKSSGFPDKVLLQHERIHLKQQAELLILPFYLWYGLAFFVHLIASRSRKEAYYLISFEKEAYGHQSEEGYLLKRKPFAFIRSLGMARPKV